MLFEGASDLCIHAELTSMDSTDESTPTQLWMHSWTLRYQLSIL